MLIGKCNICGGGGGGGGVMMCRHYNQTMLDLVEFLNPFQEKCQVPLGVILSQSCSEIPSVASKQGARVGVILLWLLKLEPGALWLSLEH